MVESKTTFVPATKLEKEVWNANLMLYPWLDAPVQLKDGNALVEHLITNPSGKGPSKMHLRFVIADNFNLGASLVNHDSLYAGYKIPFILPGQSYVKISGFVSRYYRRGIGSIALKQIIESAAKHSYGVYVEGSYNDGSRGLCKKLGMRYDEQHTTFMIDPPVVV
jgi:hypothetical protein